MRRYSTTQEFGVQEEQRHVYVTKKKCCRKEGKGLSFALTTTQILLLWLSLSGCRKDRHSEQPIDGAFRFKSAQDEIQ